MARHFREDAGPCALLQLTTTQFPTSVTIPISVLKCISYYTIIEMSTINLHVLILHSQSTIKRPYLYTLNEVICHIHYI
jgi:hypothetical protein